VIDHPLAMKDAEPEENQAEKSAEVVTDPVVRIQKR
jgi:hypothetical protein